MMLTQWVTELGLPFERSRMTLDRVQRFVFGETYYVEMQDGRCYEDKDLERLLGMMREEFTVYDNTAILQSTSHTVRPHIELRDLSTRPGRGIGHMNRRSLCVIPVLVSPESILVNPGTSAGVWAFEPLIENLDTVVRDAVTFYNLSGEWTMFKKDNL